MTGNVAYRKSVIDAVGGFDEKSSILLTETSVSESRNMAGYASTQT
jgi:hypothetical protein